MASATPTLSRLEEDSSPTQPERPTAKHKFEGHENTVWSFLFLHDNVHIVSGSEDGTMRKWDCNTGLPVGEPWKSEGGMIRKLALSPDGKTIVCVREDGGIRRWNTDGEMIEGVWEGNSRGSLSWSPSGGHIASGAHDGTILIRNAESGEVEVGPIQTNQGGVDILEYSPSGDKIASGAENETIYILDSSTGDFLVGPIKHVGGWITSVAWSLDSSKLYSASDSRFVRVFDSASGTLLRWLEHDDRVYSVALSPKNNVMVCVGIKGAQLWDTESHEPFGQLFGEDHEHLYCASFSQDGRYLAYSGNNNTVTLWMLKDIVPELVETQPPQSPSSSCSHVDATRPFDRPGDAGVAEEGRDDIYNDFFQPHTPSGPSAFQRPRLSLARRLLKTLSRTLQPASEPQAIALQERPKWSFLARRTNPRPVTVFAGRPRRFYWTAPPPRLSEHQSTEEENGGGGPQAGQPSSTAVQPPSAVQPSSVLQIPQLQQTQPATQPAQEEYGYGCWCTFWAAVCCFPHVQPTAS